MCGIAGVVSLGADLARSAEIGDQLSAALFARGPDSTGRWVGRHCLLVFQRLAVIDLAGGNQPMVATDDRGEAVAVLDYTGEVFNHVALRDELRVRGHRFTTRSDTEVVLRAYQEWGPACAERLRGMFAFAVWDVARQQLVLIRDRFGIYPLFYHLADGVFSFASEPKALFDAGLVEPVVDDDGLRELLGFTQTPGRSVFRDVAEVVPGEVVTFGHTGISRRRYWRLEPRAHDDDLPTTVRRVRDLLETCVEQQVASDVPLGTMLSGGVDSSVISALVKRYLPDGERLRTFSMEHEYHLDNFRPDEVHDSPDRPFVHLMRDFLGSEHRELLLSADDLLDPAEHIETVSRMDRPVAAFDQYISLRRLAQEVRSTTTVVLSGDGSDELFGGYVWFHDPWYVEADTFPWLGSSQGMEMMSGLIDRGLSAALDLPGHIHAQYRAALAEVEHGEDESPRDRRAREITYLNLTRYLRQVLDRGDRMLKGGPVEGRVPYCDHELVEYVYNVPWSMKTLGGREKGLLHAAVRDLVPEAVIQRRKSPFPTAQDPRYRAGLVRNLLDVTLDGNSPAAAVLDRDRLAALRQDGTLGLRTGISRISIETALQLHVWCEKHGVRLRVGGV
jgi:asparagine synthase (glutamine-hydrolysing)